MKLLLFDIDGTILLTGGAGRIAFERLFDELYGIPNSWNQMKPDGKTDPMIIRELTSDNLKREITSAEYELIREKYDVYFEEELPRSDRFRLMPGIIELLETLSAREDILLGIGTGNFERQAWQKLEQADCRKYFHFGGFGSDSEVRSELIGIAIKRAEKINGNPFSSDQIMVIGDSIHDVRAGKAHQTITVGVATGSTSAEDLHAEGADHVLEDLSQPEAFLDLLT